MPEATVTIRVKGMTCEGCTTSLTRVLQATPGVKKATVDLQQQHATITYESDGVDEEALRAVVKRAGYIPVAG